jgi:hypothetical protein
VIVAVIVAVVLVGGLIVSRPGVPFGAVLFPLAAALGLLFFVVARPTRHQLLTAAAILAAVLIVSFLRGKK